MKKNTATITIYSIGHFYVDFICAFLLSHIIFQNSKTLASIAGFVILYNIIAFGTQPFFGFFVDHYKKPKQSAIIGLIIATSGLFFFSQPFIAAIILGIGNALYHVGGGFISLHLNPTKAKYPGIFVAPGALGLFLGGVLGTLRIQPITFIAAGLLLTAGLTFLIHKTSTPKIINFKQKKANLIGIILLLLLVSVCMRSLISYSLHLEWKSLFLLGLLLTSAIAAGKFFGGFLADKYGFMNVSIIGLLLATPLLVFFQSQAPLIIIGSFCFNLVMPITLTAVAEAIPNYKGFAFGLTTLALVVGYLLFFILKNYLVIGYLFTALLLLINIGSLYFGLKKYEEMKT
jgi:FSR family fosmidomycin resistance protein-like MFS transporter